MHLSRKTKIAMALSLLLSIIFLATCGYLKKDKEDDEDDPTFGGKIPSSWSGKKDWADSVFEITDQK